MTTEVFDIDAFDRRVANCVERVSRTVNEEDAAGLFRSLDLQLEKYGVRAFGAVSSGELYDRVRHLQGVPHAGLAIAHLLRAIGSSCVEPRSHVEFVTVVRDFLMTLSESSSVHFAGNALAYVVRAFAARSISLGMAKRAIIPLERTLSIYNLPDGTLLPAHPELLQLYLWTRQYRRARTLLESRPIDAVHPSTGCVPEDVQLFHLYASRIWSVYEEWDRCLSSLEECLSVPTEVVTSVAQNAFDRRVLVLYLAKGRVEKLGGRWSGGGSGGRSGGGEIAARLAQGSNSGPLAGLLRLLSRCASVESSSGAEAELAAAVDEHRVVLEGAGLLGLARQVVRSVPERRVRALAETFITLPLEEIAARAKLDSPDLVERLLTRIARKSSTTTIRIDQAAGTASFDGASITDHTSHSTLRPQIEAVAATVRKLHEREVEFSSDPHLLAKSSRGAPSSRSRHHGVTSTTDF